MVDFERRAMQVPQETELSREIPPSLMWLAAVNPATITPHTWENGGMTRIAFRTPDGNSVINVYRTVSRYTYGAIGIQDEVHPANENEGAQYNYEIDAEGNLIKFSNNPRFSEQMQACVDLVTPLVSEKGSTISSRSQKIGVEATFESDGIQWVNSQEKSLPPPSLSLSE